MKKARFGASLNEVREYKKRMALQAAFIDQNKKPGHSQGNIKEKYWFSPQGGIFPVEYEHGDQALTIARKLKFIGPEKSIGDYGFKSKWELAKTLLLDQGWLRAQVYDSRSVGLNAKPSALEKKSTEAAVFTVLARPGEFFFQENWPYTLEYKAAAAEYKKCGWKKTVRNARLRARQALRGELEPFKIEWR